MEHGKSTGDNVHSIVAFRYADAAARLAAVPADFTAEDLDKVAKQLDNGSRWILSAITPVVVWAAFGSSSLLFLAGVNSQGVATPTRVGGRIATVSQTMTLVVQLEATAGEAHARLWDVTNSSLVTEVSTLSTTSVRLTAAGLAIVAGHAYELQIWLVGGAPPTDRAIATYGELV